MERVVIKQGFCCLLLMSLIACGDDDDMTLDMGTDAADAQPDSFGQCEVDSDCTASANALVECNVGLCTFAGCVDGFGNCDGDEDTGCESSVDSDADNCGGCGMRCIATDNAAVTCESSECAIESCDTGFADCDGDYANGCELDVADDRENCGECGNVCADVDQAVPACTAGECVVGSCTDGFADCDGNVANGCEADLEAPTTCGVCDNSCDQLCDSTQDPAACVVDCGDATRCGSSCVDLTDSVSNCGMCGMECMSGANASPVCAASVCGISCDPGFTDCDADGSSCEIRTETDLSNCGGCGNACVAPANAAPTCENSTCGFVCALGFADCDGDPANGCEVDTRTDTNNCSMCGMACTSPANSTGTCSGGTCGIDCTAGFANCDMMNANGCEVDTRSDVNNCNACGTVCEAVGGAAACNDGSCNISCEAGRRDCDSDGASCETDVTANIGNCGGCDVVCPAGANASAVCSAESCGISCDAGFGDCDTDGVTCEANLLSDIMHCGDCASPCPTPANGTATCSMGACGAVCDAGFGDCDNDSQTGCEINLNTSLMNCGGCGVICSDNNATPSCAAAVCSLVCDNGFNDCDSDTTNGCESNPLTDSMNCGGCGMVCDGPCVEGSCDPVVDGGAGLANSCVLRAGGRVFCSGQNNIGQLGVNSLENNGRFAEVPNLSAFDLDSGDASSCAIRESDRSVVCWGRGNNGEIGNNVAGRALVPTEVTSTDPMFATRRFVEVQLRRRSVCALDETGDLWCWGENNFGQLGNGTNTGALQAVKILSNVTDFSIGGFHGCAVSSGTLMCWGRGTFGQIGDGTLNNELSPVMTTPALTDVDEVEASNNATCARSGNILRCWGIFNNAGQGSTSNVLVPTIVNLAGIDAVYALRRSMCAHLESGSFVCWGERGEGQLGDGVVSTASVNAPIPAPWIPGDAKLFGDLTVFAATTGSLSVWGSNLMGQYGIDAEHSASATPKVAKIEDSTTTMSGVTDISVGSTYACAVSNGDVRCAGRNFDFTLGIPNRRDRSTFDLNTLSNATAVSSGYRHACALSGGDLYCWGSETRQQFGGAGSQARPSLIPVTTTTPGSVIGLSAGVEHNCVIHGNGQVSCVGRNDRGQVGNGATGDTSTWTDVPGVSNATQVAAGFYSTCALLTDGSVTCWGDNANGELGDGTTTRSLVPKTVAGLSNVTELRAGRDHYCAITSSRALFCWGNNPNGQIGNGTTTDALVPTMILPSSATSVAPSLSHTCVALEDGTVRCWGGNTNHQLGDGTRMQSTSPVPGPSITTAVSISSGHYGSEHTCAILQDGTVNCWGNHTYGRLGDGRPMFDGTPRTVTLP